MKRRKKALSLVLCLALLACSLGGCAAEKSPVQGSSSPQSGTSAVLPNSAVGNESETGVTSEQTQGFSPEEFTYIDPKELGFINNYGYTTWVKCCPIKKENDEGTHTSAGYESYALLPVNDYNYYISEDGRPYAFQISDDGTILTGYISKDSGNNPSFEKEENPDYTYTIENNRTISYQSSNLAPHNQWVITKVEALSKDGIVTLFTERPDDSPYQDVFVPLELIDWSCSPELELSSGQSIKIYDLFLKPLTFSTPDYSYLNDLGFQNLYGHNTWVASNWFWESRDGFGYYPSNTSVNVANIPPALEFNDGYISWGKVISDEDGNPTFVNTSEYPMVTYTATSNSAITLYSGNSAANWIIYKRYVDEHNGIVALHIQTSGGSSEVVEFSLIPADFVDWNRSPEERSDGQLYYYYK